MKWLEALLNDLEQDQHYYFRRLGLVGLLLALLALGKYAIIRRLGDVDFEPDSYLHFLQVKTVYTNFPDNVDLALDVWAKPLYTLTHGAWLLLFNDPSLEASKILNLILFALVSFMVYLCLRTLKLPFVYSLFGAVISNVGFLSLRSSISTLTEPWFTLIYLAAIFTWIKGWRVLSALLIGISVLGRLEALLFVGIWGLYWLGKLYQQQFRLKRLKWQQLAQLFFLITPTIVWNLLGYLHTGRALFLISNGYPTEAGIYGFGHPFYYLEGLAVQEGMLLGVLLIGLAPVSNSLNWSNWRQLQTSTLAALNTPWGFIIVNALLFLLAQSFLYTFGLFGTAGILRYFVLIMPIYCLLASYSLYSLLRPLKLTWLAQYLALGIFCLIYALGAVSLLRAGGHYKGLDNKPATPIELQAVWDDPKLTELATPERLIYANRPEPIYYSGRDLNQSIYTLNFAEVAPNSLVLIEADWARGTAYTPEYFSNRPEYQPVALSKTYPKLYVYLKE